MSDVTTARAPLFRDPIYDGAADPTVIWNHVEKNWWMVYTSRRANMSSEGVGYCYGTDIGIACSNDQGASWTYRGILQGLEFEAGRNTFWAPEIIFHDGTYHMFVSYFQGVRSEFGGESYIVHYTSKNLWDWKKESIPSLSSRSVIDACVHKLPNGRWRMWYKDECYNSHTYAADSDDLFNWTVVGPVITDCRHEGPNVFQWKGYYWMIIDEWKGFGVFRSDDAVHWERNSHILGAPGLRKDDGAVGRHGSVLVNNGNAYIFYFTHPNDRIVKSDDLPYDYKRTSIQVARLEMECGRMICERDRKFEFILMPES